MGSVESKAPAPPRRAGAGRPFLESAALPSWVFVGSFLLFATLLLALRFSFLAAAAVHVGALSLLTFLLFGLDKWRAARSARRVSETNLLLLSAAGGALGGLLAMSAFRHKRRRLAFRIILPVALFCHVVALACVRVL